MILKNLIELCEVREKQAFALTSYLNGKVSDKELQERVNAYCKNLAYVFVVKYRNQFLDEKILVGLRRYISTIGADKPHSGHRFYEELYKSLNTLEATISDDVPEILV